LRTIHQEMKRIKLLDEEELMTEAKRLGAPYELVCLVKQEGRLPVPNFAAGGIATPADAALAMQLGAESVFVGSGIFKSENPETYARAVVKAVLSYDDPAAILEASKGLGNPMKGLEMGTLQADRFSKRGW
jgi:pyridoxal 5'-phosphate synthase pdxS subunit